MSIGPSSLSVACAAASTWSGSATSVGRTRAFPPRSSTSRAVASRPAWPRARSAIFAPSCANLRAVARPIPPDAPVMTTTSLIVFSIFRRPGEAKPPQPCGEHRSARALLALENLDGVAVAQLALPPDLLSREARRRPPDAGAGAALTQLVVDRVGDVQHRRRRWQRNRVAAVAKVDAHQARQRPQLLTQPVEA